jgi:TolB protein
MIHTSSARILRNCLLALAAGSLALPGLLSPAARAEDTPTITVSKSDMIALAIQPISGPDGPLITRTLQSDLAATGYFTLTSPGSASLIAGGSSGGSDLDGKVSDHSGRAAVAGTYSGDARARAHAFANDIVQTLTGNRGIAGTRIAFCATRTGRKEIYLADCDGSAIQQLTHDNSISVDPSLSSDGRLLAYTGYKAGYADIYLVNLSTGSRDRIIKYPGTNSGAAFSPNGERIACTLSKDGNVELYVCGLNGSAHRLTHTPGIESSPTWSPNGDEIIYSYDDHSGPQLYRISAGGGSGERLSTGFGYCTEPNWSPDGGKVAFNVREGGSFAVAVMDLRGGSARIVGQGERPVWGPDSRHLIFSDDGVLYLMDVQSGRKKAIISGLGRATEPTWAR